MAKSGPELRMSLRQPDKFLWPGFLCLRFSAVAESNHIADAFLHLFVME